MTTLNPTGDSWVWENTPTTNYGTHSRLDVSEWYTSGDSLSKYTYVIFDLSLETTVDLVGARLYMYATGSAASDGVTLKKCTSSWTELGVTWNNRPSVTSTNEKTIPITAIGWYDVDILDIIKSSIDGVNYGIGMFDSVPGYDNLRFDPRTATNHMYLVLTYATHAYVKTNGDDSKDGTSWANAWATINKAATTVPDGTIVHIGFGTYNAEPANNDIAPVNAGEVGIKYLPETETTGGGTGSVIVEVN
jgi:hypothetical protein